MTWLKFCRRSPMRPDLQPMQGDGAFMGSLEHPLTLLSSRASGGFVCFGMARMGTYWLSPPAWAAGGSSSLLFVVVHDSYVMP